MRWIQVFGDVRGAFSFSGANVEVEQIKSRPHTRASATTAQSSQRRSSPHNASRYAQYSCKRSSHGGAGACGRNPTRGRVQARQGAGDADALRRRPSMDRGGVARDAAASGLERAWRRSLWELRGWREDAQVAPCRDVGAARHQGPPESEPCTSGPVQRSGAL